MFNFKEKRFDIGLGCFFGGISFWAWGRSEATEQLVSASLIILGGICMSICIVSFALLFKNTPGRGAIVFVFCGLAGVLTLYLLSGMKWKEAEPEKSDLPASEAKKVELPQPPLPKIPIDVFLCEVDPLTPAAEIPTKAGNTGVSDALVAALPGVREQALEISPTTRLQPYNILLRNTADVQVNNVTVDILSKPAEIEAGDPNASNWSTRKVVFKMPTALSPAGNTEIRWPCGIIVKTPTDSTRTAFVVTVSATGFESRTFLGVVLFAKVKSIRPDHWAYAGAKQVDPASILKSQPHIQ